MPSKSTHAVSHGRIALFFYGLIVSTMGVSLVAQMVKRLPTMQETRVQSLGWEDLLEKEMATHSSILAWKIPWTEEPDRLRSTGLQSQTQLSDLAAVPHTHLPWSMGISFLATTHKKTVKE